MILDKLTDEKVWYEFLEYKRSGAHSSDALVRDLTKFIENKEYLPVVETIMSDRPFALPELRLLNKKGSVKKRSVFVFDRAENYVLKLIAYLLGEYDHIFEENLYSFKRNVSVKNAIAELLSKPELSSSYGYKVDIHDYFNSVDTEIMIGLLERTLIDDAPLKRFIAALLRELYCLASSERVKVRKGIMAGVPISGFLADLYLTELDGWFAERGISYARYSDDIIVFAQSREKIEEYEARIKDFLKLRGLTVNPDKESRTEPGEKREFLGFCFDGDEIDISPVALRKLKDKIRRKSHALVRWKCKTGADGERAIRAFVRHFNLKFYNNDKENELTWCRWYFPTITTDKSLKIIDEYMVENIRFIATGRHSKANYRLRYEQIKALGYRSLVNSYYRYKKDGRL